MSSSSPVAERIRAALIRGETLVLAAECEVYYEGRGRSHLGRGERIVLVKPDGSVLVHRPWGYEPVNWQPPGSRVVVREDGNQLELRAVRDKPREILVVRIYKIIGLHSWKLRDAAPFSGEKSEKDMKDAIAAHPEILEDGLRVVAREYPVAGGFVDLLADDSDGRLVVIEVKRGRASTDAVVQLKRYVEALKKNARREVRGMLVSPSVTRKALSALKTLGLEYRKVKVEECIGLLKRRRREETSGTLTILEELGEQ